MRGLVVAILLALLAVEIFGYFTAAKRPLPSKHPRGTIISAIIVQALKALATWYLWSQSHFTHRTFITLVLICAYVFFTAYDVHRTLTKTTTQRSKRSARNWTFSNIVEGILVVVLAFV